MSTESCISCGAETNDTNHLFCITFRQFMALPQFRREFSTSFSWYQAVVMTVPDVLLVLEE